MAVIQTVSKLTDTHVRTCRVSVGHMVANKPMLKAEALWRPFLLPLVTVSCRLNFLCFVLSTVKDTVAQMLIRQQEKSQVNVVHLV